MCAERLVEVAPSDVILAKPGHPYTTGLHDLRVVEHVADRVAVMHRGKLVELQSRIDLFRDPQHGPARELLASIP